MIPSGGSDRSVQSLILEHLRRYPLMEPADLYKLLFQAAMGSSHDMPDPGIARERLLREMQEMGEGPEEALLDGISPSGDIARVHLRPWRGSGFDTEALLEAFARTARE
ncbi:hypothetical protein JW921_09295, partial [Candidatus Fermentibacterales bacterium]|nr:hypothetical protein [Candidatus Fermentibacterales bacterium]